MERRTFLFMMPAAALASSGRRTIAAERATVLYGDRAVSLDRIQLDPKRTDTLWVHKKDLPQINEFELKPEGACRADVCIPVPKDMTRGDYFDLTAFARRIRQSSVAEPGSRVWSFGEIPLVSGAFLKSRTAPDFAVADRRGRLVHLSDSRGKKRLLVTWASW
jgi:hypothetical protein